MSQTQVALPSSYFAAPSQPTFHRGASRTGPILTTLSPLHPRYHSEPNKDWHLWHFKHVATNSSVATIEPSVLHVLVEGQSWAGQPSPAGVPHTSFHRQTLPLIQPVRAYNGSKSPSLMNHTMASTNRMAHSLLMLTVFEQYRCKHGTMLCFERV